MSKICCVADADTDPKSSSCSMILRSACSHSKHSRESSHTSKKSLSRTPRKSKYNSKISEADSLIQTLPIGLTLKELALKSPQRTYSLLKGYLSQSSGIFENAKEKVLEENSVTVSSTNVHHISYAASSTNLFLDKSSHVNEDSSSVAGHAISCNDVLNSTLNMSRTRFTRSAISSVRSLSGSEGEDEITVERITRARRSSSDVNSNYSVSQKSGEIGSNGHHLLNNQVSYVGKHFDQNSHTTKFTGSFESVNHSTSTEASAIDRSTLPHSSVDKFRWFLWRCMYLKIIRNINFDVWFLSRLHNYGKHKAIFFFLLPLIFYIIYGILNQNTFPYEAVSQKFNSAISPFYTFFSSLFSSLYSFSNQRDDPAPIYDTQEKQCFSSSLNLLQYFSSLWNLSLFSGWFTNNIETVRTEAFAFNPSEELTQQSVESDRLSSMNVDEVKVLSPTKEEIRLLAIEVFRKEIHLLKDQHLSETQNEKDKWLNKEKEFQKEMKNLRAEFESLSVTVERLGRSVLQQEKKNQNTDQETINYKKDIDDLNLKLETMGAKIAALDKLKTCCDKQSSETDFVALIEEKLNAAFKNIINDDSDPSSQYYFFTKWLNQKFFCKEKLMQEISAAFQKYSSQETSTNHDFVIKVVESTVSKYVESIKKNLTESTGSSFYSSGHDFFSEEKVKKIIKEAIMLYDADKTGQVDYALESGGGSVLGTRCTETYYENNGKITLFGVPLWTSANSPRTAIQPDMQPGRCWGFRGSQGFLVLELSATIYPTGFTMEHIPVSLSPTGSIDSAPKNFSVLGLKSEKDDNSILLGEYMYDIHGEPLQYFAVQNPFKKQFNYVELQIHSNHGNLEYTCLYRFRVHGKRA